MKMLMARDMMGLRREARPSIAKEDNHLKT